MLWLLYVCVCLYVKIREVVFNYRYWNGNDYDFVYCVYCIDYFIQFGDWNYVIIFQSSDGYDSLLEGFWDIRKYFFVGFIFCDINYIREQDYGDDEVYENQE